MNATEAGPNTRQLKVARQIQRDLSEIFQAQGMAMYDGAMISVVNVRISPDLSVARVWISVFPSAKAKEVLARVQDQQRALRGEVGRRVAKQLRIVPELIFYIDDSLDYVEHIDQLLKG
ncbi:MAG: 30S ribosome-binding factor RbfA [Bacteroidales bacterium]|jgi:ribosome-binding factor A|nr:30S ribosome-binding factor RbfA [Bacteroidales bacterium]MDD4257054.1 30S ribosome-binding factor RbfA [Bacteroidales bacterium]MDD4654283.1 30S ribosome-binding factor RbfA [Bacteroidales bacterium]MDD4827876.1 30S ribosome-binding factor RbfA [Bacteroidales bacterium]HNY23465.1 30S ribosome-binding factor RbfA [Bacteroidales bacterium]